MYILGISGGTRQGNQDGSATVLKDGKIVAFVEEERLFRVKHAAGRLPENAVRFVLKEAGISIEQVDKLTFPGETYSNFEAVLERYFISKFGFCPPVELVHHHDAHCASAFYASGFSEAMILSYDLSGDGVSTQLAKGQGGEMDVFKRFSKPNSLGIYYSLLTQFMGFTRDSDEYKVMGLSSYGRRGSHDLSWLLQYGDGEYQLNTDCLMIGGADQPNPSKQEPMFTPLFLEKLGSPRLPDGEMISFYEDIAASGQEHLENVLVELVTHFHKKTGLRKLCLAGGVALNCVANQKLMGLDFIDEIFIQPAASDAGLSLGAAYIVSQNNGIAPQAMESVYLGPEFTEEKILEALELTNVKYEKIEDISSFAADQVFADKIVGWFQGRMEVGPRALGNRSILANPCNPQMQDIVNEKIKFREKFRPFTPSVLEEDADDFFLGKMRVAPYMTITFDAKEGVKDIIPSVVHVDETVRVQTVRQDQNKLYYNYLQALKAKSGHGVTMNTSFNVKGDPVVNTPYNALATFYGSGMDTVILGNFAIQK
jgi:carbamoyltransferase